MPEMFKVSMTVEGIKHRVEAMLSEHMASLDEEIKIAVGMACNNFNVGAFVREETNKELKHIMSRVIAEAVEKGLKESNAFKKRVEAGVRMAMESAPVFPDFESVAKELLGDLHPTYHAVVDAFRDFWLLGRRGF